MSATEAECVDVVAIVCGVPVDPSLSDSVGAKRKAAADESIEAQRQTSAAAQEEDEDGARAPSPKRMKSSPTIVEPDVDSLAEANQMHPRNIYRRQPPDFLALAKLYPEFQPYVSVRGGGRVAPYGTVDWSDVGALHALTSVLLLHDFRLRFSMPQHHLCPPVPQRLNYIHWVADLLRVTETDERNKQIRGVDVGTGASCIFPLLGHAAYGWRFLGTEIDPESVTSAEANVTRNQLQDRIEIRHVADSALLLDGVIKPTEQFDFLMCNPPFFSCLSETGLNASRASAATASELICPGGEERFVADMIRQSKKHPHRIRWCTTMLGRKSSLKSLTSLLRSSEIGAVVIDTTEFRQGQQTRFGLAWTFDPAERAEREKQIRRARDGRMSGNQNVIGAASNAAAATTSNAAANGVAVAATPTLPRQKVRFLSRANDADDAQVSFAQSLLARLRAEALSYASTHGLSFDLVSAGAGQIKVTCAPAPSTSSSSSFSPPLAPFSCDLLVLASTTPHECMVDLQWRKTLQRADDSKRSFTRFAIAMQDACEPARKR